MRCTSVLAVFLTVLGYGVAEAGTAPLVWSAYVDAQAVTPTDFDSTHEDSPTFFDHFSRTIDAAARGSGGGTATAAGNGDFLFDAATLSGHATGIVQGTLSGLGSGSSATANAVMGFEFSVFDRPETLTIDGHIGATARGTATISVGRNGVVGSSPVVYQRRVGSGQAGRFDFHEVLQLLPGTYHVTFLATAPPFTPGNNLANYDISFAASNPSTAPAAIPLPPAVWTGGAGLVLAVATTVPKRRRCPAPLATCR